MCTYSLGVLLDAFSHAEMGADHVCGWGVVDAGENQFASGDRDRDGGEVSRPSQRVGYWQEGRESQLSASYRRP